MTAPELRLIRSADYVPTRWKNGGGTARQIIVEHGGACTDPDRFLWQAGIADIERDGPFSDFTGYDRIFTLVSGNGITLDGGKDGKIVVDHCFEPHVFSGDWRVLATLHNGPTQAFNIVYDRSRARATVVITDAGKLASKLNRKASVLLIHNFSDLPLEIGSADGETIGVQPADTAIFGSRPKDIPAFTQPGSPSRLALVQIEYL
ncbi:MAG: HutD family protein [Fimbriimonadaceae bacterium]|nr:HutD family protein [Alphaproteobacteria bacterium]